MLLDTLKLLAFEDMDVKINKYNDHICITNSKTGQVTENGKNVFKYTTINTEITIDGEIIKSDITESLSNKATAICDKYPSYNYFNKVPLKCSEIIQRSMEVYAIIIPTLTNRDSFIIDRYGSVNKFRY
ncbi:MAG: hypothetical protein JTJ21_14040 [Holdemanella sp.]|nr:hypothetical protein [Holdemanella sp.]